MRKFFKIFCRFFEAIVFVLAVGAGAFLWRLHKAPIDIDRYIPDIVQFLANPERNVSIAIRSAKLKWGRFSSPIELEATDFKASFEDGAEVLSVPKVALSFSVRALLIGRVSPRSVTIYDPFVHLNIDENGGVSSSLIGKSDGGQPSEKSDSVSLDFIISLLEMEDDLSRLSLKNARFLIQDDYHHVNWEIPKANLTYRHTLLKHRIDGDVTLKNDAKPLVVTFSAHWRRKSSRMNLELSVKDLKPSALRVTDSYAFLKNISVPVDLTANAAVNLKLLKKDAKKSLLNALEKIEFHVAAGGGLIDLPAPVSAKYDARAFALDAVWYDRGDKFDVTRFALDLESGASASGTINVSGLAKAFETGDWQTIDAVFKASARDVPLDNLRDYWPASAGEDVHGWVTKRITKGRVPQSDFELRFKGVKDGAGLENTFVDGHVDLTGATVTYLDDMPPAENVEAVLLFTTNDIKGEILSGGTFGVAVTSGTIGFLDLDKPHTYMTLDLNLSGGVRDALRILNYPYLNYITLVGMKPENAGGALTGKFSLVLPFDDAPVKLAASGTAQNASMKDVFAGYDVSGATVNVSLADDVLNLSGEAMFYGSPATFDVRSSFVEEDPVKLRIAVKSALKNETRRFFDYGSWLLLPPAMDGLLKTSMLYEEDRADNASLTFDFNLKNLKIYWDEIGWIKPPEKEGEGRFVMPFKGGKPQPASFSVGDVSGNRVDGTLMLNADCDFAGLAVKAKTGRTDIDGIVSQDGAGDINVVLTGRTLDLAHMIHNKEPYADTQNLRPEDIDGDDGKKDGKKPRVTVTAKVDKVWLSQDGAADNTDIYFVYADEIWRELRLSAFIRKTIPLNVYMTPAAQKGLYELTLRSTDAGETLRTLDYIDSVQGGNIEIKGVYNDSNGTLDAVMKISEFRLANSPIFLKMLSLSGIVDTVKGEGMLFNHSVVPFVLTADKLTVKDGVVAGPSLGVTLSGDYNRKDGLVNFRGALVPLYTINSLLGKIPLIGKLFSGEKGGGLFAPTYKVTGRMPSPDISIKGWSALAPGAVRSLIDYFSSDDAQDDSETPNMQAQVVAPTETPLSQDDAPKKEISSSRLESEQTRPVKKQEMASSRLETRKNDRAQEKELTQTLEKR